MADYILDDAGLTIPALIDLIKALDGEFLAPEGFGPEVDLTPDSPLYKVSRPVARQLAVCWQGLRDFSAQIDPSKSFGQQLDFIGSLLSISRRAATRSTLAGRALGTPGEPITAGSTLRYLPTGSLWQVVASTTIGAGGIGPVDIESLDFGPVEVPASGAVDWEIVTGQGAGWAGFEALEDAALGKAREEDPEYRARLAEASLGLATYDAIVREIRGADNVTAVWLYVNLGLVYDPIKKLEGKQMRPVVRGGTKANIIAAMHRSMGAPVDTAGFVTGTYDPGNGQILDYAFDREVRRRGFLRITITGGNPGKPLPTDAIDLALQAVALIEPTGGTFSPYIYGQAAVSVLPLGSVTKMKAEGRLDLADPWVEDAIEMELNEVVDISVVPSPAQLDALPEDDIFVGLGSSLEYKVNGGVTEVHLYTNEFTKSADAAADLQAGTAEPVVIGSLAGRLFMRTIAVGSAASVSVVGGSSAGYLFGPQIGLFGIPVTATGSDGDVEIVIL